MEARKLHNLQSHRSVAAVQEKKRNETTVGYFSRKHCFAIKLHTHASSCGNHLHCLFCARKMLKTVDRKKNPSSQASFTDHSKNSRKGLAVRKIRPGVTLYLTQALWYVMGAHLSLSSSLPLWFLTHTCILQKQKVRQHCTSNTYL